MSELREFGGVPDVDPETWSLGVTGTVSRPRQFTVDDLRSLDLETYTHDFSCVEGWVAEGLAWRGIRVGNLLSLTEPDDSSRFALVRAIDDGYACSFPLDRLSDAILALDLDGEPLPPEHGGPARLVPSGADSDCWESIKWVDSIDVTLTEPVAADTAKEVALSRVE